MNWNSCDSQTSSEVWEASDLEASQTSNDFVSRLSWRLRISSFPSFLPSKQFNDANGFLKALIPLIKTNWTQISTHSSGSSSPSGISPNPSLDAFSPSNIKPASPTALLHFFPVSPFVYDKQNIIFQGHSSPIRLFPLLLPSEPPVCRFCRVPRSLSTLMDEVRMKANVRA